MNATIPSFKAPVSSDPQSGAPPVDTEKSGGGQDFAGALAAAAAKPSRKSVQNKAPAADSGGGTLPVPGSPSPLAAPATALSLPISIPAAAAPPVAGAAGVTQQAAGGTPQSAGLAAQTGTVDATLPPLVPTDTEAQGDAAVTTLAATHAADAPADSALTAMTIRAAAGAAGNSRVPPGTTATDAAGRLQEGSFAAGTDDDSAADSVGGTGTSPAASAATPASGQSTSAAALDMALAEGGDATGAAATAVQASESSTTAAFTPAPSLLVQNIAGISGSPSAVPQVATATLAVADASALSNLGDADKHAHGGGGDAALGGSGSDGTAAAQQLSSTTSSTGSTDASSTPSFKMNAGVDSAEFPQGLADRVSFMIDSNLNGAKLQVNPPQLGPIELQIAVQGDHAQVSMSTHSAVTREALESSLPKLREMLGAQGFGQVSVDISQRSFQERSAHPQPYEWTPPAERAAAPAPLSTAISRSSLGALDTYA
jgi:flagellar hook-length control protein FliK